jgi:iron-sulfur cluster insertion protein
MITVTDIAGEKFREILAQEGQPHDVFRMTVIPRLSGELYTLAIDAGAGTDDLVIHEGAARVITDIDSAPVLEGAQVDYIEGLVRSGFIITDRDIGARGGGCFCGGESGCQDEVDPIDWVAGAAH